jgi:hypothetical protein
MDGGRDDTAVSLSDAQAMEDEAKGFTYDSNHWSHYSTDDLRHLLGLLEAMEQKPQLTIAGVKAEVERRQGRA